MSKAYRTRPLEAVRGLSAQKYSVKYGFQPENRERWWNHLLSPESRGVKTWFEFMATQDYLPWFIRVSHPSIENPAYTKGALTLLLTMTLWSVTGEHWTPCWRGLTFRRERPKWRLHEEWRMKC
ncbi:hypothetical protein Scep_004434 [Stephania cephalantha]|uniref:Uncharacterized protein n=1 Tax=Stephania cephalantha TaxID=152367 RepID=A0AAP0KUZ3_9MAGN